MKSRRPDTESPIEPEARDRSETGSSSNMLLQLCRSAAQKLGIGGYKLDVKQQQAMERDMTQEERNKRGKELDDGFFEGYTDTFDKHDRIQAERRQKGDEELFDEPASASSADVAAIVLEGAELEDVYRALLRTVQYRVKTADTLTTASMHEYMQKVLRVSDQQHAAWMDSETRVVEHSRQVLRVSIIRGTKLPAKDSNDMSDPFCVLGLVELPPRYLDGKSKTKKVQKLVKDKSKLHTTEVIAKNLNPEWNQSFDIDIDLSTVQKQVLQIDVWDSDEDVTSVKSAVKANVESVAGFFRYVGQVGETVFGGAKPDFMGRVFIPLQDIPEEGIEQWYHILNRKQRQLEGKLRIGLRFVVQHSTRKCSVSFEDAFSEHVRIHQLFSAYESQQFAESGGRRWDMKLSSLATRLLQLHASQHDLMSLEEALVDWIIVVEHHELYDVDYEYMLSVTNRLRQELDVVLQRAGNGDVLDCATVSKLTASCLRFHEWCFRALSKLRVIYPANHKKALIKLGAVLKCLEVVYRFPVVRLGEESLVEFLNGALQKSTADWFERQEALVEPQVKTDDSEIQAFVDLASDVVLDLYQAVKVYRHLLKPVGVDYVSLVYKDLDSLLSPRIEARMRNFNKLLKEVDVNSDEFKVLSTASFQLYLALKEIYKYKPELPTSVVAEVQLFTKMHSWFKPLVARWFELANVKAICRIDRAIELDQVRRVSDTAMHSTSAVDTVQCLLQLCELWKRLDWPVPEAAFLFVLNLTDVICEGALHYGNRLHGILEKTGYYDDEGQFDVTEQLCITLNNIHYVQRTLSNLADSLGWDKVIEDIAREGGTEAAERNRASLIRRISSTDDDLVGKCHVIVTRIGTKMGVDIRGYLQPLVSDPESVDVEKSITGLMDYLSSNLQTLSNNLFIDIFKLILFEIYRVCVEKMRDIVVDKRNLTPTVYNRLLEAIEIIVPFFYSNGNGLSREAMEINQFKQLHRLLHMRKKKTPDLVGQYFCEIAEEQDQKRVVDRGTLTVQVGFIAPDKMLCVKVLNGRNLPVMDPTGSSDPFATLELFPHYAFQGKPSSELKTAVQKETTTPLFDETFLVPCEPSTLTVEGAAIMFTCYDWDRFTKNDLMGEAVCLLSAVETVDSENKVDHLTQIMLPLSLPSEPRDPHSAYYIIESRTWDKAAVEFIKMRKKTFKSADAERK